VRTHLIGWILPAVVLLLTGAAPAAAQPAREKIWFSISGGIQATNNSFNDSFDLTLYTEPEHVTVNYPAKSGFLIAGSGAYRVWRQLFVGVGVTHYSGSGDAQVTAQLPHPFFDATYRSVEGTAPMTRSEVGAHMLIGWMLRPSRTFRVMLTAGPSYMTATQPIVTEVTFTEAYPYDTAQFTGVKTIESSRGAAGFNAGADVFWMFGKNVGAGGMVQFTHARIKTPANAGRSVSFDAGGGQVAAGLRFLF
jgi:hypothetical protein